MGASLPDHMIFLLLVTLLGLRTLEVTEGSQTFVKLSESAGSIRLPDHVGQNYTSGTYREWLIASNSSSQQAGKTGPSELVVELKIVWLETECSFDTLSLYEGKDPVGSNLLASFSGTVVKGQNPVVIAQSGSMLLVFFSDGYNEFKGFEVEYTIRTARPSDRTTADAINREVALSDAVVVGRSAWAFGGRNYRTLSADLVRYDLTAPNSVHANVTVTTTVINPLQSWPAARHSHSMALLERTIFMYGGELVNRRVSDELWVFELNAVGQLLVSVRLISSASPSGPGPLKHFSFTAVPSTSCGDSFPERTMSSPSPPCVSANNGSLLLFGGVDNQARARGRMYEYSPSKGIWTRVEYRGLSVRPADLRIFGHSAVLGSPHLPSQSLQRNLALYVFGGGRMVHPQIMKESSDLFAFSLERRYWWKVTAVERNAILPRTVDAEPVIYHSAVGLPDGRSMLVFGGTVLKGVDKCARSTAYKFDFLLGGWSEVTLTPSPRGLSRYTLLSFPEIDSASGEVTLGLLGGFDGSRFVGGLSVVTVPTSTGGPDPFTRTSESVCTQLSDCMACVVGGQGICSWSSSNLTCVQGVAGELWSTERECQLNDTAGIMWSLYKYPPNLSNPDAVQWSSTAKLSWGLLSSDCEEPSCHNSAHLHQYRGETIVDTAGLPALSRPTFWLTAVKAAAAMRKTSLPGRTVQNIAETRANAHFDSINDDISIAEDPFPSKTGRYYVELSSQRIADKVARQNHIEYYFRISSFSSNLRSVEPPPIQASLRHSSESQISLNQLQVPGQRPGTYSLTHHYTKIPASPDTFCSHHSCLACARYADCGWCPSVAGDNASDDRVISSGSCFPLLSLGPSGVCPSSEPVSGRAIVAMLPVSRVEFCDSCEDYSECFSCTQDSLCEWHGSSATCNRRERFQSAVRDSASCNVPCESRANCSLCLSPEDSCHWCSTERLCVQKVDYLASRTLADRCPQPEKSFISGYSASVCESCSQFTNCTSCQGGRGCGWCGDQLNPRDGLCSTGSYSGPTGDFASCPGNYTWSYEACPDLDECILGESDCHTNASCTNTPGSYNCSCLPGFVGDGVNECNATCWPECVVGVCSGAPLFECNCSLGWYGESCAKDCGCYNHSACDLSGPGVCDECMNRAEGARCERCSPGSFGNATLENCEVCDCNMHSEEECDRANGSCSSCLHNTAGERCERCMPGYYGNPRNGGTCYLAYTGRTELLNLGVGSGGYLGATPNKQLKVIKTSFFMWILSVHSELPSLVAGGESDSGRRQKRQAAAGLTDDIPLITVNVTDIHATCHLESLYLSSDLNLTQETNFPSQKFINFCTKDRPSVFTSSSGYLVILFLRYRGDVSSFNASYEVSSCRNSASPLCVCPVPPHLCFNATEGCDDFIVHPSIQEPAPSCAPEQLPEPAKRTGHVFVSVASPVDLEKTVNRGGGGAGRSTDSEQQAYLFGGELYNGRRLRDMWVLNVTSNVWTEIPTPAPGTRIPWPRARSFAAGAFANGRFFLCGGLVEDEPGVLTNDNSLWIYNPDINTWTGSKIPFVLDVRALVGHTLSVVHDMGQLVLLGGYKYYRSEDIDGEQFNTGAYHYNYMTDSWLPLRNGTRPPAVYFHSASYHAPSKAIYVFGGVEHRSPFSERGDDYYSADTVTSSTLYAYSMIRMNWSIVPPAPKFKNEPFPYRPVPRYLHSSIITTEYLLLIGGMANTWDETYVRSISVYSIYCDTWFLIKVPSLTAASQPAFLRESDLFVAQIDSSTAVPWTNPRPIYGISGLGLVGGRGSEFMTRLSVNIDPISLCSMMNHTFECISHMSCIWGQDDKCTTDSSIVQCDAKRLEQYYQKSKPAELNRCHSIKHCQVCLAKLPLYWELGNLCKWCGHGSAGECKPITGECSDPETPLPSQDGATCSPEDVCHHADCQSCAESHSNSCQWSDFIKKSGARTVALGPNWGCHSKWLVEEVKRKSNVNYQVFSNKDACPQPCVTAGSCRQCVQTEGHSGGAGGCYWSLTYNRCMSHAGVVVFGAERGGVAGVWKESHCPADCSQYSECTVCLMHAHCGWCSTTQVCMEGIGGSGPSGCPVTPVTGSSIQSQVVGPANHTVVPGWFFYTCPPENECITGHHTCNLAIEECVDLERGFDCVCLPNYERGTVSNSVYVKACTRPTLVRDDGVCVPQCPDGCIHGCCQSPGHCYCDFGFVGEDCSKKCDCNLHSTCNESALDDCLGCKNNTLSEATKCDRCEKGFVGDPTDGRSCMLCSDFCGNRSETCEDTSVKPSEKDEESGPKNLEFTKCIDCKYNSEGPMCGGCKPGYFNKEGVTECQLCSCNGHSSQCDQKDGSKCGCQNNTVSSSDTPDNQCDRCLSHYSGDPVNDHQCYRTLTVDSAVSLKDAEVGNGKVSDGSTALPDGSMSFFVIKPKFTNINIRLYIDVIKGAVNIYITKHAQTFRVHYNNTLQRNVLSLDPSPLINSTSARPTVTAPTDGFSKTLSTLTPPWAAGPTTSYTGGSGNGSDPAGGSRKKRSSGGKVLKSSEHLYVWDRFTYDPSQTADYYAVGVEPTKVIKVSNVSSRLVITFPHGGLWDRHDLMIDQFFVAVEGVGGEVEREEMTYSSADRSAGVDASSGFIYFRQDQPQFDMFIFFTVFFAFIFKILAFCAIIWKFRQFYNMQRQHAVRIIELKEMAARPFVSIDLLIDKPPPGHNKGFPRPVGVEFLDRAPACIGTFVFELPGGPRAPTHTCFGSTLMATTKERNKQVEAIKVTKEEPVVSQTLL